MDGSSLRGSSEKISSCKRDAKRKLFTTIGSKSILSSSQKTKGGETIKTSKTSETMKMIQTTLIACLLLITVAPFAARAADVSSTEARAIAKEAYVYGLLLVMGYKAIHETTTKGESPQHQVPFNQIKNEAWLYTPEDKAIVVPNSDTPYSFAYLDLRAEPVVLSTPEVEPGRYFSVQLINLYAINVAYHGG